MLIRLLSTGVALAVLAVPAFAADPIRPNHTLTPGVILKTGSPLAAVTTKKICVDGYSKTVRNVPASEKTLVFKAYKITDVPHRYEVDHLISLELGGSNDQKNLWPQSYVSVWNAHVKDRLENTLHKMVCNGDLTLTAAQHAIRTDWIKTYKTYIGPNPGSGSADRNDDEPTPAP
jgi:hypothetical protein